MNNSHVENATGMEKIKKVFRLRDETTLNMILYACKTFGVLPITIRKNSGNTHLQNTLDEEVVHSKHWLQMTILHITLCISMAYFVMKEFRLKMLETEFYYLILFFSSTQHYSSASFIILLSNFFRRDRTLACIQKSITIYNRSLKSAYNFPRSLYIYLCYPLLPIISIIHFYETHRPIRCFQEAVYNLYYFPLITTELLISVLCFIAQRALHDINKQLYILGTMLPSKKAIRELECLMHYHADVIQFSENMSQCFSLDFVYILFDFISRTLLNIWVLMSSLFNETLRVKLLTPTIIHNLNVFSRIIFVFSQCQRVESEAKNTSIFLHRLHLKWLDYLNSEDKQLIKLFSNHIATRKAYFTGYGMFIVNISYLCKVFGIVTSYSIITVEVSHVRNMKKINYNDNTQ